MQLVATRPVNLSTRVRIPAGRRSKYFLATTAEASARGRLSKIYDLRELWGCQRQYATNIKGDKSVQLV